MPLPPPPRRRALLGAFSLFALVVSLTLLPAPAPTEAQTAGTGITIRMAASSAPNSFSATASFGRWRENAVHALRNGLLTRGDRQNDPTGYYQALDLYFVAQDLMVTTGNSWRGEAVPAAPHNAQHGNRVHFGFHAYGDGTVQFRLKDAGPQVLSAGADETLNAEFVLSTRTLDCGWRHGWNWGADRTKGTADDVKICTSTHANTADEWLDELVYAGFGNAYWPDSGLSSADQADKQKLQQAIDQTIDTIDRDLKWFSGRVGIVGNNGTTYRASKTILNHRLRQSPGPAGSQYDWCFNRLSDLACANNIGRWEGEAEEINLPDSGHCPATHQIRTAKNDGTIKCEQTYHPVLPPGGALAEAWGVTRIAPPVETTDDWDGTERQCSPQGHGYYSLPTDRHHGLGKGCHYHNGTRQDLGNVQWSGHHEHKFVNRH